MLDVVTGPLRSRWLALGGLVALAWLVFGVPASAQMPGCRRELPANSGAQVSVQVLTGDPSGELVSVAGPARELEARSGQIVRLFVRPLEGPDRPDRPECAVRVNLGRLPSFARIETRGGFVFDNDRAYAQFSPGEERVLDFRIKPFEEWTSVPDRLEVEGTMIRLSEVGEFVGRLPAGERPAPGTICADVVYPDAQPANGIILGLSAPPGAPADARSTDADGRVCWDGVDELLFGDLSLRGDAEPALGMPSSRYVSHEASYRLFVIKRAL